MDTAILRSARTARGLTQQAVAQRTKLPQRLIAAVEEGRFEQIPSGFYARAYVRMYARAVGLEDPDLIQQVMDAIPKPEVELQNLLKVREARARRRSHDRTAAAVDAAVVAAISTGGVLCYAALAGPGGWHFPGLGIAFLALAVPTLILYFVLLGATGVGTVGARLFHVEFIPHPDGPLDGAELLRRTGEYFRSEAVALLGEESRSALDHVPEST